MNLKTDIQLGFPLAVEPWEFVLVKSTLTAESLQGWLTASAAAPHATRVHIANLGAGTVLHFNNYFTTKQGFRFYHIADTRSDAHPARWEGHSDTVACTLALAQSKVSSDAPIILISCNCDFTPEGRLSGALLSPVSDSDIAPENGQALYQKWRSALQRQESIVGLVLFESDIAILLEELQKRRQKAPPVIPIAELDVMQLLTLPRSWPALISVGEGDLVQLAERLGIDGTPFKPTLAPRAYGDADRSFSSLRPSSWRSSNPAPPLTPIQKAGKTVVSVHTLKVMSISGAIIAAGFFGAQRFWGEEIKSGKLDRPVVVVDLSNPVHDLLSPADLVVSPTVEDMALPRISDELVQPPVPQVTPGTVRTIGGCDMVMIRSESMPSGLKPFWLDRTEVTTEAYEKCVERGLCHFDTTTPNMGGASLCNRGSSRAQHPINCVTYNDAARYCAQMGKFLPTAVQWDYAARGDSKLLYPWGDTVLAADAVCWKRLSGTCPVNQHPADKSPFGVLGMGANVGEWTSTKFYPDPELSARVFRGWSWGTEQVSEFFGAKSHGLPAEKGQNNLGFRCAKDVSAQD